MTSVNITEFIGLVATFRFIREFYYNILFFRENIRKASA
jgi:hypothetical protein